MRLLTDEERMAEYLICQRRGHEPSGYITASIPPKNCCRWCGTYYWIESLLRESGEPKSEASLTPEQERSLQSHGL